MSVSDHLGQSRSIASLLSVQGAVRELQIVSAYGDVNALQEAFDWLFQSQDLRTLPLFKIFVDKNASRFLGDKKAIKLAKKIKRKFAKGSGIFLVKTGGLFHSKAFFVRSNQECKFAFGSMNFTLRGVGQNEEVLLIGKVANGTRSKEAELVKQVQDYMKTLTEKSINLLNEKITPTFFSFQEFLLNGELIYEVKQSDLLNFKLNLPKEVTEVKSENISDFLSASITDSLQIEKLILSRSIKLGFSLTEKSDMRRQPRWKKYCIQTCYGYWFPKCFTDQVKTTIGQRREKLEPYYLSLREIVVEHQKNIEEEIYSECNEINKWMIKNHPNASWDFFRNGNNFKNKVSNFMDRVNKKLKDERIFERLVSGIDYAKVPILFTDIEAANDIEDSFMEDLLAKFLPFSVSSNNKESTDRIRQGNCVARIIWENMNDIPLCSDLFKERFISELEGGHVITWFFDNIKN